MQIAQIDTCDECGFDGTEWGHLDAARIVREVGSLARDAVSSAPSEVVGARLNDSTWSISEYLDHMRETLFSARFLATIADENPGSELAMPPEPRVLPEPRALEVDQVLAAIEAEATALYDALRHGDVDAWVAVDHERMSVGWTSRHALHDSLHHLHDIARLRTALDDGLGPLTGSVVQVSASSGGVPKLPVEQATVTRRGLDVDAQADTKHHGRPIQALCLYSVEVIDALRDEGHPIEAGAAGENLTIKGIDWDALRVGLDLVVGDVIARLTAPSTPCAKNDRWFADGSTSKRIDHDLRPGWSRWYASVISGGTIRPGDGVEISSPSF